MGRYWTDSDLVLANAVRVQEEERWAEEAQKGWALRRWESARTNRLNAGQWQGAYDESINADLGYDLPTLRARCHWELQNNIAVKGVVETYVTDLVGEDGPSLDIISEGEKYNRAVFITFCRSE